MVGSEAFAWAGVHIFQFFIAFSWSFCASSILAEVIHTVFICIGILQSGKSFRARCMDLWLVFLDVQLNVPHVERRRRTLIFLLLPEMQQKIGRQILRVQLTMTQTMFEVFWCWMLSCNDTFWLTRRRRRRSMSKPTLRNSMLKTSLSLLMCAVFGGRWLNSWWLGEKNQFLLLWNWALKKSPILRPCWCSYGRFEGTDFWQGG